MSDPVFKTLNPLPRSYNELAEAKSLVRDYHATVQIRSVRDLLKLLDAAALEGLRKVEPDRLQHEQGRLAAFGELLDLLTPNTRS